MNKKQRLNPVRRNVYIVSLGCTKNFVDTEVIAGHLITANWGITMSEADADAYLINTCAFIQPARDEATEAIEIAVKWKSAAPKRRRIIICGCLIQWDKDEIFKTKFPQIDLWAGLDFIPEMGVKLSELFQNIDMASKILPHHAEPSFLYDEKTPRLKLTVQHLGYVKIAEGCNNNCAYCTIPSIRGKLHSRTIASIRQEVSNLINCGTKELVIMAQDITAFGHDRHDASENLAKLLQELDKFSGEYWIRLLYTHPAHITDELISVIANAKHIVHYLDMPLQHIDNNILKKMGRKISSEEIYQLLYKLRQAIPDIAIRTTLITGLPYEGEKEFQQLVELVKNQQFHRLGVFPYYPEIGTPAAKMPYVNAETADRRADELATLQAKISLKHNLSLVGKKFDVIVDSVNLKQAIGRTYMDAPQVDNTVVINKPGKILSGSFVRTIITGASKYDLEAQLIRD
jgi:ribosomal protein S12 methylthiotransferase